MPDYYIYSHLALGNAMIQLAAAVLICHTWAPNHTIRVWDGWIPVEQVKSIQSISNEELTLLLENMDRGGPAPSWLQSKLRANILQMGYGQHSEPLVQFRDQIFEIFHTELADLQISKGGTTVTQALAAPPPFEILDTDIAIHVRLGDYRGAGLVIDPAPQIAILRQLRLENPTARIFLVTQKPTTDAERNYLKLFEEVRPILQCGTELEDFAVLRSVRRLIVTNSSFSWVAAWMAAAGQQERWIPAPIFNELGAIEPTDHMYEASHGFPLESLEIPTGNLLPVTGEFLQSLCDYTVLTHKYKAEMHKWIDLACPPARQLFTGEEWPEEVRASARSLFVYPDVENLEAILRYSWPALRLLIIHNGDNTVPQQLLDRFLEGHPAASAWVQNATDSHPRQRILPIGFENRIWRNGRREIEGAEQEVDTPIEIRRPGQEERPYEILVTHNWPTHPSRTVWNTYIQEHCRSDPRVMVLPRLDNETYSEALLMGRAIFCPRGNGYDTHRAWEVLLSGGYPILFDIPHTRLLKSQYPSLPLLTVSSFEEFQTLKVPATSPSEFHPLFLREYWNILFNSHLCTIDEK